MVRFAVAFAVAVLAGVVSAEPLSVEQFFKRASYSRVRLSPDGKLAAAVVPGERREGLAVIDLETKKGRPITNFGDADVLRFFWINNHRLVFSVGDAHEADSNSYFYGWYAVNVDGSHLEEISSANLQGAVTGSRLAGSAGAHSLSYGPGTHVRYLAALPDGSDHVLVEVTIGDKESVALWDTMETKRLEDLTGEITNVTHWVIDQRGRPRAALSFEEGREKVWYRDQLGEPWRKIADEPEGQLAFRPLAFGSDGTFYVTAYQDSDKAAIFRYDTARGQVAERVARHLDANMESMIFNHATGQLLGYSYEGSRTGVIWIDAQMARVQNMASRALPNMTTAVSIAEENPQRALITSWSSTSPPTYYLLDADKRTMEKFSSSRPWINAAEMSERRFVRYKARDGLEIPSYLTIPKGSSGKNLPLVVEIHGGPWIDKQTDQFNVNAQFLASRGYAVLQPDFRGTRGYGKRHFEASFGQWGYAMQDDITDGVEWLIREGIADRNRICLLGASYGGYATLWGLIKTPELYRCGVAYVALTDISYMFDFNLSDYGRSLWTGYDAARTWIGDPNRDAEKFNAVSPVQQAARLKAPVLLAYGGADQRVPLKNGTALRAALDKYGKTYEWVVYDDEGHGFNDDKNRFDFWRRVDAFLKKYLTDPATSNK